MIWKSQLRKLLKGEVDSPLDIKDCKKEYGRHCFTDDSAKLTVCPHQIAETIIWMQHEHYTFLQTELVCISTFSHWMVPSVPWIMIL